MLFGLVLIVFLPVVHNGFINFDDPIFVYENPHVRSGLSLESIRWAFTNLEGGFWYPLTCLSNQLDWRLFGANAGGHHFTSLLLHAVNTVLLFLVFHRLTQRLWPSAVVAALFGLHPLHVEPVAWAADRKDVLSTTFWVLAMLAYVRYAQRSADTSSGRTHRWSFYGLALLFFTLGLMSKTMLVTLPAVLLLLDFWPLRRWDGTFNRRQSLSRLLIDKLPFAALALAAVFLTIHAQHGIQALPGTTDFPLSARFQNAFLSYVRYVIQFVWPHNLTVRYPYPASFPAGPVAASAVVLVIVSVLALRTRRARPYIAFGWFWYLLTLFPVIGLIQIGGHSHADRYMYVPAIGLSAMAVWGVSELAQNRVHTRPAMAVGSVALICLCAAFTRHQLGYWKDSETLFRHSLAISNNDEVAHNNLGSALAEKGNTQEAIQQWSEAIRLLPDFPEARLNLGLMLAREGKLAEALSQVEEAVRLTPSNAAAQRQLGDLLVQNGRAAEAIPAYEKAMALAPDDSVTHLNLGHAYSAVGRFSEASSELEQSLQVSPNNPGAHNELGLALAMRGRLEQAAAHFQKALELKPDYAEASCNLGIALLHQGKANEAAVRLAAAVRIKPAYPEAQCNLGVALANLGRTEEALAHLREACRLRPDYAEAQANLATLERLNTGSNRPTGK